MKNTAILYLLLHFCLEWQWVSQTSLKVARIVTGGVVNGECHAVQTHGGKYYSCVKRVNCVVN